MLEPVSSTPTMTLSSDRGFGLVFTALLTFYALAPLRHHGSPRPAILALALLLLATSLLRPGLLHLPNLAWAKLGLLLHHVVNPLLMAILFFGVFTPMAIVLRLLGKDPLRLRTQSSSYWIVRTTPGPSPSSLADQF